MKQYQYYVNYLRKQWRMNKPVATWFLIITCTAIWLFEMISYYIAPSFFSTIITNGAFTPLLFVTKPWTAVTSLFLHAPNIWHLTFNMMMLWLIGPTVERYLGHAEYLAIYFLSGIGSNFAMMLWSKYAAGSNGIYLSVYGASGAILGLCGTLLVLYRKLGFPIRSLIILLIIIFAEPLLAGGIAWQSHIGGCIIGCILMACENLYVFQPGKKQKIYRISMNVGMLILLTYGLFAVGYQFALPTSHLA